MNQGTSIVYWDYTKMYMFLYPVYSIFRVLPYQTISLILTCLVTECPPLSIKLHANWVLSTMRVTQILRYILRDPNQF